MNPTRETPFTIALTHNEVVALVKYHVAQTKAIPKKLGAISMKLAKNANGIPKSSDIKSLHKEANEILSYHTGRARGLVSLLPKTKKG
jgi:hypothetical protein